MRPEQLHRPVDQLATGLRRFLRLQALAPSFHSLRPTVARRLMELGAFGTNPRRLRSLRELRHRLADQPHIALREWQPLALRGPSPVVFFIHGGGWVLGSSRSHRAYCELLAEQANCTVFSVDYRLAPEHPFPGALEDVERAWQWLQELRVQRAWQQQPVVVAGDSAGGNLATVLCRRLRDAAAPLPDAQFLIYPVTDFAEESPSRSTFGQGFILDRPLLNWFSRHYLSDARRDHPDLSPLRCQDLRGLPPAFISLAGLDMLFDEGLAYARRLEEADVPVRLKILPDMMHGFINLLAIAEARAAALATILPLQEFFATNNLQEDRDEQSQDTPGPSPLEIKGQRLHVPVQFSKELGSEI